MKKISISEQLAKKGFKLRTWAKSKGLSDSDYNVLLDLSKGKTKGKWGKAKELKELLQKEFKIA
ncbi:hypothetical protein [Helicobacter sp. UBA3407]|uniref:hypothetical protein n=1 Tax=Helicobacter TaxID=209 RepID=UPI00262CF434|nr:hypothetical protein [Helicobacter sp. UBA3407]